MKMFNRKITFTLKLLTILALDCVQSMIVIPERANITVMNKKYVSSCAVNVRRHGRKSPYLINMYGVTFNMYDVTVDLIFSQLLHNEYRRSFIEMHYKLCELINEDIFVGAMLKKAGLTCPLPAGEHYFMNMTVPTKNFKNVFPFEKGRVDVTATYTTTKEVILQIFVEATFKQ